MPNYSRRQVLFALGAASFRGYAAVEDPWADLPRLLKRIQPPAFPGRDFNVTRYGAKDDGKSDGTAAFRQAIDEVSRAGGWRVVVPAGTFLTGAIHLKSN